MGHSEQLLLASKLSGGQEYQAQRPNPLRNHGLSDVRASQNEFSNKPDQRSDSSRFACILFPFFLRATRDSPPAWLPL